MHNFSSARKQAIIAPSATAGDQSSLIYSQYIAAVITQLPNASAFKVLDGTSNAQASFYYKSPTTGKVNAVLYNNILSPRVKGLGKVADVDHVRLESSPFTSGYLNVYQSMQYSLSQADQAAMQRNVAESANSIKALRPQWNAWVSVSKTTDVPALDMNDTDIALMQITATMQTVWLNPAYAQKLKDEPGYPYGHMNDFDKIFQFPASVPKSMHDLVKNVYAVQGIGGTITARRASGLQQLAAVTNNITSPNPDNGGMPLTSGKTAPAFMFEPNDPITVVNELSVKPPSTRFKSSSSIKKSNSTTLSVSVSGSAGISIPAPLFFSVSLSGGASSSIFTQDYAGSDFSVNVVVNNPTLTPLVGTTPMLYDLSTQQGWMDVGPIREALKNKGKSDVTGFVFTSNPPDFNFGEGGDFGYVESMVLSQYLELELSFSNCTSSEVKKYFEQHASASVSFLGIHLGSVSESSSYSYAYSNETKNSITVTIKPPAPGYTPGGSEIGESLCNLLAVGVKYPVA